MLVYHVHQPDLEYWASIILSIERTPLLRQGPFPFACYIAGIEVSITVGVLPSSVYPILF